MEIKPKWPRPPGAVTLQKGEVHVWRFGLEQPEEVVDRFRVTLEPDELDRASRFHFEKHQRHFVVGRGLLRDVLSRYLQARPEGLRFSTNEYGKPSLSAEHALRFNLSHSHEVALVAVTRDAELGVDVEYIRTDFASEAIAKRFFSRLEVEMLSSLSEEEQVAAFFRCWTRKEAYIKAIGKGLSQALDRFDVTLVPNEPAMLLRADEEDEKSWSLSDIDVGPGYAAALAVEGARAEICCWDYVRQD